MALSIIQSNGCTSGESNIKVYDVHGKLKIISGCGGGPNPPASVAWGDITGIVTNQTDLINYLDLNYYPLNSNPAGYLTQTAADLLYYPLSSNPAGYLTDAPSDGSTYGRNNGVWTVVAGGTTPTLQQVVNAGNGISNFGGTGNASIQSTNFTNNRTLYLNDNAYPTIRIVDNLNAANNLQIDVDTLTVDGVSYNWSSIVNPPSGTLVALPFTTDHITATGNPYLIGDVVYYLGNVYRCIAGNDSILPTNVSYWTSLGAGNPLVQQPSDWNSTSGNNQILNKPTIPSVTPAALTKTDDTNVTLTLGGTPATSLLQAVSLTLGWAGTLATGRGGTGLSSIGTSLQYLRVNSGGTALEYATFPTIPTVTPSALTKTDDTNVTLTLGGTPSTALLQATSLTLGWTGQLSTSRGGTGLSSIGSSLQYLRVNTGGTALEYATFPTIPAQYNPTAGTGISITGAYPNQTISNTLPDQTVVLSNGTGISVSGTYPSFTITNSAPDQTVVLTAGTGIGITGTYPSFTISNSDPTSGVTLTSAGGTETLVNDGTGPTLATKGLSASTGISLSSNATAVTITNSAPDQTVSLGTTGTGLSVTGTYPSFTLQNTLPDQTVALSAGTGISISGTYPSFSISNSLPFNTPLITKGDIYVRNASADTRLPVGLDTQMLVADSSEATGLKWTAQPAATPTGYYGAWQDNNTQTAAVNNTAYAMIYRTVDLSNGVTVVTDGTNLTRITFANTGIYNIQFSAQLQNLSTATEDVTIWLRKNGIDLPATGTIVGLAQRKGPADPYHTVASWNFVLSVVAGEYYQLMWSTTNHTDVTIPAYSAISPAPSVPSIILTVTQQSGIMAGTGITAINSLTGAAQTLTTGTTGTDFGISSSGTTHTFNLPVASSTNTGKLSSTDWTTFNNKVPSTRTLTINGTGYDLSADRSWTVGSVTSVGGTGTVAGITLTGTVTSTGNLTLGGTLAVPIANITATGTPSSTTYLRGDGTWATIATGGSSATIGSTIDGSGGTITTGTKGYVQVPYACTINSWRIIANASGSIVIDIWKAASPTIPTVANTITGSAKPTLSSAQTSASSTLTGWTTSVAANDIIGFNVDSATTVSWVIIQLFVTKT